MQVSSLEERLKAGSDVIFQKFCAALSKIDPVTATVCAAAAASIAYTTGFGIEVAHQANIMSTVGKEALEAYRALTPDTTLRYLGQALSSDLPSLGQNIKGASVWMMMTAPAATYVASRLAKHFGEIRAGVNAPAPHPTGATRVEQLQTSIASVSAALDKGHAVPEATAVKKTKGLS